MNAYVGSTIRPARASDNVSEAVGAPLLRANTTKELESFPSASVIDTVTPSPSGFVSGVKMGPSDLTVARLDPTTHERLLAVRGTISAPARTPGTKRGGGEC